MAERAGLKTRHRRSRPPTASASGAPSRIGVIQFTASEVVERAAATVDEVLEVAGGAGVTWISVDGPGDPEVLSRLGQRFGLHPLALEDSQSRTQRPKVEPYADHYFVVTRLVRFTPEVTDEQVSFFFGRNFVLTIQEHADGDMFQPTRDAIRKDRGWIRSRGADFLAYSLLDAICDAHFPVIEVLGGRVDDLEDLALAEPSPATLRAIQDLRHDLQRLRRAVWPMREELAVLQREHSDLITAETRVFLRDAQDHAVQSLEMIEGYRETVASIMEVYLSAQNQRLNEVMKVLTVIATVFIPLTFIASIYGMNFEHMPELHWRWAYPATLGLMGAVALAMAGYFKRRGWW